MDKVALLRRLMKTFLGEFEGHIHALDHNLVALESGAGSPVEPELLDALFRTAHTLKGAARAVDVGVLEAAAHHLESIFHAARDGTKGLGPEILQLLFLAVDAIKDTNLRLTAGLPPGDGPLAALLPMLQAASGSSIVSPLAVAASLPVATAIASVPVSVSFPVPVPVPVPVPMPMPVPVVAMGREEPAAGAVQGRSVRVSAARLDRILDLGGELLVVRRRAKARDVDVSRLLDMAKRSEVEWRQAVLPARRAARRSAGGDSAAPGVAASTAPSTDVVERTEKYLQQLTRQLESLSASLRADRKALDQVAEPLEAEVLRSRMMPFAEGCEGLERAARDVARTAGKEVDLVIEGGEIEIDRSAMEDIKDPLLHLLRNAVDHGIEPREVRMAAGKRLRGLITIAAALRNGRVEVVVADDGGGLDLEAIRRQALKKGLAIPAEDQEVARLIFAPGFSTAAAITTLSGRGVGLDVVKTAVEARRGRVDISFEAGRGTRFVLFVPTTLTRLRALLVRAGGQIYAFDCADVQNLLRVGTDRLRMMEGRDVLTFDGRPVPVMPLTQILGLPTHEVSRVADKVPVVVLGTAAERAAFSVDELLAEQEVVIKDLGPRLRGVRSVVGATVLTTGRIALILDAAELVATSLGHAPTQALSAALGERPAEVKKRLLVVDDSVTTRTLVKAMLDAEGYTVTAAADGLEAWQLLQDQGADLVVSDVEMPRMDGFGLAEAIRGSARFRDLPVILMTSRESEKDRLHGMEVGATAYLPKSAFDQSNLIDAIRQIL